MLDLNDVYYFVQVVDHKSITAAARALALPKSTISYRINQLESQLGARLINRTSRQFAVTDIGAEFYRRARLMLQQAQAAESAVRQRMTVPSGLVRISVAVATSQFVMSKVLPEFGRQYPQVRLLQRACDAEVDIVAEGFDVAVRAHTQPLQDSNLIQRPLAPTPWMLFCSPKFLEESKPILRPDDLLHRPALFMIREGVPFQWTLRQRDGELQTLRIEPVLMTDCMLTLRDAAVGGLGIVALPGYICRTELEAGHLVRVLPDWTAGDASLTALVPYGQNQLPSVRALIDYLVAEIPRVVAGE
jgi:DNA-binding transcriptional LysR family regulator